MFVAPHEALDEHAAALVGRDREGGFDLGARGEPEEDAATVVAVLRLHDDGQADVLGGVPGVGGRLDHPAFRHGHAARAQQ